MDFPANVLFDATDAFEHVVDTKQGGAHDHSENPRCLRLDPLSNQWMKSFACGEIDFDAETLFEQSLGRDQVESIEPAARIVVHEKINITPCTSLVARSRTK
ncbi:hypothetical protein ACVW1B_007071 [Bradyrhizobium sp. USDA 4502]